MLLFIMLIMLLFIMLIMLLLFIMLIMLLLFIMLVVHYVMLFHYYHVVVHYYVVHFYSDEHYYYAGTINKEVKEIEFLYLFMFYQDLYAQALHWRPFKVSLIASKECKMRANSGDGGSSASVGNPCDDAHRP
jgi:hypothetical protein